MKSTIEDKDKLVNSVFSEVHSKYDLMNDIMSLGVHRIWKEKFIEWMSHQPNTSLIDVASGTGDIAKLFLDKSKKTTEIVCVEPNVKMLKQGQNKLSKYTNIKWINSHAEKIPVSDDTFDYYSISYGIRNVTNIHFTLKEALRVLKRKLQRDGFFKVIKLKNNDFSGKIVTKLSLLKNYCVAEEYHQKYLDKKF